MLFCVKRLGANRRPRCPCFRALCSRGIGSKEVMRECALAAITGRSSRGQEGLPRLSCCQVFHN
eukprot:92501-Lingulodinium_polyedra.AAC.1